MREAWAAQPYRLVIRPGAVARPYQLDGGGAVV
jgi:hypothetical protein